MSPPVQIGLIILFVAVMGALLLVVRLVRHRRENKSLQARLPDGKRVGGLDHLHLLELRRMLGAQMARDATLLPRHEVELTRHALWYAMLLEAGADNEIDATETDFVASLYGEIVTNEPRRHQILESGNQVLKNRASALGEVARAAGTSPHSKMHILRGAFLVSISNNVLEPAEAKWLDEIADALSISPAERALMFDELADSIDLQVARQELPFWETSKKSQSR